MDYLTAGGQPTDKLINFAADDGATADRVAGGVKGRRVPTARETECERLSVSTVGERSKSAVPF